MASMDTATLGSLLGVVSAAATTVVLIVLANYVMSSIGYMRLAERRNIKNSWLIWVPIIRNWTMGAVADSYDETKGIKRKTRILLPVFSVIKLAVTIAIGSYVGMLAPYFIKYGLDLFIYAPENFTLLVPFIFAIPGIITACVIYKVCYLISLYKTFESTDEQKGLVYTIISGVFPFASGLIILLSREKGYSYQDLVKEEENEEIPVEEELTSIEEFKFQ